MTSRREFLQISLTGGALLAISDVPHAFGTDPPGGVYKAIFDQRFPESLAFANDMRRRGIPTHGISGDVTALWYHDLHFAWQNGPIELAGVTTQESLFCLETLARDAGHRVTARRTKDNGLVSWTIAPRRPVERRLQPPRWTRERKSHG
jgi:hypothetical protein